MRSRSARVLAVMLAMGAATAHTIVILQARIQQRPLDSCGDSTQCREMGQSQPRARALRRSGHNSAKSQKATRMSSNRFVASVLACSLLLSGCTSMKRIQPATAPGQPVYEPLKPGDTVVVQTPDGEQERFVVDRIDGDTIVARDGTRFTRQDIVRLERRALSGPKTAVLIGGIAAGTVLLVVGTWIARNSRVGESANVGSQTGGPAQGPHSLQFFVAYTDGPSRDSSSSR